MRKQRAVGSFGIVSVTLGIAFAVACGSSSSSDDSAAPGEDGSVGGDSSKFANDGSTNKDVNVSDALNVPDANLCTTDPCVVQISAAGDDTCALLADKTMRCWGRNDLGQLGVGATDDAGGFDAAPYSVPFAVPGFTGVDEVVAGDFIEANGWTCARSGTTTVRCWGSDAYAMLGRGDASVNDLVPHPDMAPVVGLTGATQIGLGGGHSCAVIPGGNIECWGDNVLTDLGRVTDTQFEGRADLIEGGTANYTSVALGEAETCALQSTGIVTCWGWNDQGQLGRPDAGALGSDPAPTPVPDLTGVTQLVNARNSYCAMTSTGAVLCWGSNTESELGLGDSGVVGSSATPTAVSLPSTATLIGSGQHDFCAVLSDASLWCWGDNSGGQLGDRPDGSFDTTPDPTPRKIAGISGKIVQLAGGFNHMCALYQDGAIDCWGGNTFGQLGRGVGDGGSPDNVPHPTPAPVVF
jgi:alpha-tubulin suppressor-like RCC1 family protein